MRVIDCRRLSFFVLGKDGIGVSIFSKNGEHCALKVVSCHECLEKRASFSTVPSKFGSQVSVSLRDEMIFSEHRKSKLVGGEGVSKGSRHFRFENHSGKFDKIGPEEVVEGEFVGGEDISIDGQ
jgi:hypothetical protein